MTTPNNPPPLPERLCVDDHKACFSVDQTRAYALAALAEWDHVLRQSVPERWKDCTSPIGAVQGYIAELEALVDTPAPAAPSEPVGEIVRDGTSSPFSVSWLRAPGPAGTLLYTTPQPSAKPAGAGDGAAEMMADEWKELYRLREAVKGPDGFATWQDAATAERVRRMKAERALAEHLAPTTPAATAGPTDAERLDWLDRDGASLVFKVGDTWYSREGYGLPVRKRQALREAIDEAMGASSARGEV